jgi:thymidylate synthase (FAD)
MIQVQLLAHTPLSIVSAAIRQCWDSFDKGGNYPEPTDHIVVKDKELIDRVANKMKHESVKNHATLTFQIQGITTKTLLALTRHDVGIEFSVQSSRYTTKKCIKSGKAKYTESKSELVNKHLATLNEMIKECVNADVANDEISLLLPQAWQYNLICTMSLTALQHFLSLRLKTDAHWDIRNLAKELYKSIPESYLYLFEDQRKLV